MGWEVVSNVICYLNWYEDGEVKVSDKPDMEEAIMTEKIKLEFSDSHVVMAREFSDLGTFYSIDGVGMYKLFEIAYYENNQINVVFMTGIYGLKKFRCDFELI